MMRQPVLVTTPGPGDQIQQMRDRVTGIRERARTLLSTGAKGIQVASFLSEAFDAFLVERFLGAMALQPRAEQICAEGHAALIAVGGSGRGEMAPYSDVDLLFLYEGPAEHVFAECTSAVVRDYWDAGIKVGQSVRTFADALATARHDPQFATSLFEARTLWGNDALTEKLRRKFLHRISRRNRRAFVEQCIASREQERRQHGAMVQQLEPDVKRSLGGLRDLHLIRWVGYAHFGAGDMDSLRLEGALNKEDAWKLNAAWEFLTRVRIDLHLAAGRAQEKLTREEQLRMAAERDIVPTAGQLPVERFMQEYFQHSMTIAETAHRFIELNRSPSLIGRGVNFLKTYRVNGILRLCGQTVDVSDRHLSSICQNLSSILRLYQSAALYRVDLAPRLVDRIRREAVHLHPAGSAEEGELFLSILNSVGNMGSLVRSLYDTQILDLVIPEVTRTRGLLQFNMYHSYTVDEHTLHAMELIEAFDRDEGPVGTAYRAIQQKQILHLALLLHDLGKGLPEDHSEVGRRIAADVGRRLHLSEQQIETLVFLVFKHLEMAHVALRRDISDPTLLLRFSHEVGSPERLRMLYVLTVADISAVGPGVWTEWKAELLGELFARTMLILSGKYHLFHEQERIRDVKQHVRDSAVPLEGDEISGELGSWLEKQLDAFSPHYLTGTPPARIAADLAVIRRLQPGEIVVEGHPDEETGTVDYRIITDHEYASGCSHRIAGALTAARLDILSAQITTSADGIVVDGFRVVDHDYQGAVPQSRIDEIARLIRQVVKRDVAVADLFQRHRRFNSGGIPDVVQQLPLRVVMDNESSDRSTIIDVFAHDRPGLLYTICRACFEMELSVELAKISTHFDQVVDVFYVTDMARNKIRSQQRLEEIRSELADRLADFERQGHQRFVG